jgi:hypothetical protein
MNEELTAKNYNLFDRNPNCKNDIEYKFPEEMLQSIEEIELQSDFLV